MSFVFNAATKEETVAVAREVLSRQPIYLDTETTGLTENDEIIEIAVIDHACSRKLDILVRPTIPIPSSSTAIHGISDGTVISSPFWNEIWPQVNAVLKDQLICSYNSDFDKRIMQQTHRKFRLPWNNTFFFFDIMGLSSIFYHDWDPIHRCYRLHRLENAGKFFGIQFPNSHRALDDALLARAALHSIAGIRY